MDALKEAVDLELGDGSDDAKPGFAAAYEVLDKAWCAGDRRREVGLHLMYLAWYLLIEPPHLTGRNEKLNDESLSERFRTVHTFFEEGIYSDAEMLYVVGLMAYLGPWLLGDVSVWERLSGEYRKAYRKLAPKGLESNIFHGRGEYGNYFAGHAALRGDVY